MKIIYFILILFGCTVNAQFKTQYNNFGDQTTEIVDPLMMKQGKWTYYNNENQIIRQENYINNELIDRTYFSNNSELKIQEITSYQIVEISNNNNLPNSIHGEVLINENGKLIEMSFYLNQDEKLIQKHKKDIKNYLKSLGKDLKKTIITF